MLANTPFEGQVDLTVNSDNTLSTVELRFGTSKISTEPTFNLTLTKLRVWADSAPAPYSGQVKIFELSGEELNIALGKNDPWGWNKGFDFTPLGLHAGDVVTVRMAGSSELSFPIDNGVGPSGGGLNATLWTSGWTANLVNWSDDRTVLDGPVEAGTPFSGQVDLVMNSDNDLGLIELSFNTSKLTSVPAFNLALTRFEVWAGAPRMISFAVEGQYGIINEAATPNPTIELSVPDGTDLTSLAPTIVFTGSKVSPSTGVAQDFTNPVTYSVTGLDNITVKNYKVTITPYHVGGAGQAGGSIFYDKGAYSEGWRYMEAAPASSEGLSLPWETFDYGAIGSLANTVGSGSTNTADIILVFGVASYAASYCGSLEVNGQTDWFLPSRDELTLMFEQLHLMGLGDFSDIGYWSSSETDDGFGNDYALVREFNNLGYGSYPGSKFETHRATRCVRVF